jgi:hypothetical protein
MKSWWPTVPAMSSFTKYLFNKQYQFINTVRNRPKRCQEDNALQGLWLRMDVYSSRPTVQVESLYLFMTSLYTTAASQCSEQLSRQWDREVYMIWKTVYIQHTVRTGTGRTLYGWCLPDFCTIVDALSTHSSTSLVTMLSYVPHCTTSPTTTTMANQFSNQPPNYLSVAQRRRNNQFSQRQIM